MWKNFGIPCIEEKNITVKIKQLYEWFLNLKKSRSRKTLTELNNRHQFADKSCSLFDIGYADTVARIKDPKDLKLYKSLIGKRISIAENTSTKLTLREKPNSNILKKI